MSTDYVLHAEKREEQGKGASRRLRAAGKVPAIVYGAGQEPQMISLSHAMLLRYEADDAFFSQILTLSVDGNDEKVIIRDYQRHPFKPKVLHVDLLRIKMSQAIQTSAQLSFVGADKSPGVKLGGSITHNLNDVEIACMPGDLPESIEVDVSEMNIGDAIHLTDLVLPEGVSLVVLNNAADMSEEELAHINQVVVAIQSASTATDDDDSAVESADSEADDSADSGDESKED